MALSGTLKDFALPDIFQLIGMQRKTGLLTLESDRETVSVVFEQGMVVHADSTVRRLDDLLGNVLVRQGKMRQEILEEALAKQKVSMQRLGFILTSQGYIERADLTSALSEQVQQIVFRVFRWKSGNYHFDPSADTDYDRDNASPVSTDHILMEGIRRVDEWPIIEKRIPSLESVTSALGGSLQQIVFRVFRWKSGNYHFDPSADTDYDRDNASPVSTDHILMEGIRRVDEWPIIEKRISGRWCRRNKSRSWTSRLAEASQMPSGTSKAATTMTITRRQRSCSTLKRRRFTSSSMANDR